jgi:hypothetical protein
MPTLELKPSHQVIKDYYQEINQLFAAGHLDEGAVAPIFGNLLRQCTHQARVGWSELANSNNSAD